VIPRTRTSSIRTTETLGTLAPEAVDQIHARSVVEARLLQFALIDVDVTNVSCDRTSVDVTFYENGCSLHGLKIALQTDLHKIL